MIRSGPVWAIITAHTCHNWGNYTILICIPMYMKEVLKFDVKQVPEILLCSVEHLCYKPINFCVNISACHTRSSAIAERPRDAPCQLKPC